MRHHSRHSLMMPSKLMNQFLFISAPLPDVQLSKLEASNETLIIIHDYHISYEVFFDR